MPRGDEATIPRMFKPGTPLLPLHPAAATASPEKPPCERCTALCCRYFALQLDTPEDDEDFDHIKWYLIHGDAWVWVDDGEWYLQVDQPCRHLGANNECTIYEKRPKICREYGLPERRENPEDPLCDYFAQHLKHDLEFRSLDELEAWSATFLADREEKRRRRSAAAKKSWRKRNRG